MRPQTKAAGCWQGVHGNGLGHNHESLGLSIYFRTVRVEGIPKHLGQAHQLARIKRATLVCVVIVERLLADVDVEFEAGSGSRKSAANLDL